MKILVVCQYYYPDPFRLNDVVECLVNDGHEVTVLTGTPNYVSKNESEKKKVLEASRSSNPRIIRALTVRRKGGLGSLGLSYISFVLSGSIKALLMRSEFDVILVYQLSPVLMALPALLLKKKAGNKVVLYCLDLWPESMVGGRITYDSLAYKIIKEISIRIYETVDCLAYSSRKFKDYFEKDLRLAQRRYEYIPQFAEDIYSNIQRSEHEGINFIFAGNVGDAQSVETIIKAAKYVKNPNIKWHIVGDGRALENCKRTAKELNVEEKIIFHGRLPIEEMPRIYSMADAMIVTLADNKIISYTLPGKVQSYMAAGLPLLASASGETPAIIAEAKCGLCCEAEDSVKFAQIADEMASVDRTEMGKNAKEYYLKHFTKQQYVLDLEDVLVRTASL